MISENGDGDSLQAGWGKGWIKAQGALVVILIFILVNMAFVYLLHHQYVKLHEAAETERRLLVQEARLEVQMIRGKQDIINGNITRFCGVSISGAEEDRALQAWYVRRKKEIEEARQAIEEQKMEDDRKMLKRR